MLDEKGNTLMHVACFKDDEEIALKLMERAFQLHTLEAIQQWVNIKTKDDGFTALHFATFRGNLSVAQLLLKYGANM